MSQQQPPRQQQAIEKRAQPPAIALLQDPAFKAQIAAALPRHMTPDRMALTELRKNPDLMQCDPMSFAGAIIQCSQLGLEPGSGLGQAYLVPFNNRRKGVKEVNFITGYRGLIELARRSGQVDSVVGRAVRERDRFLFAYGDEERIEHVPFPGSKEEAGPLIAFYAIARLKGGGILREVMDVREVEEVRDRFGHGNPVWKDNFEAMGRKTVIRRLAKFLPMSPELADAIRAEETPDGSQENWRAIDADYEPKPVLSEDATTVSQVNAEAEQRGQERDTKALLEQLVTVIGSFSREGVPTAEVYQYLGFEKAPDWSKFDAPRLVAMLEALKSFTRRAP
jgi:recombination protein RecT